MAKIQLNKDERKMFETLYEKALNFDKKIEKKKDMPLLKTYGPVKTAGDAMNAIIMSLTIIGEAIIGKEVC